jgi:hypothetical protein
MAYNRENADMLSADIDEYSGAQDRTESLHTTRDYHSHQQEQQVKLGRFKLNDIVRIRNSSGEIEDGWYVSGYNRDRRRVVLMGNVGDLSTTALQRFETIEDLERWNPR